MTAMRGVTNTPAVEIPASAVNVFNFSATPSTPSYYQGKMSTLSCYACYTVEVCGSGCEIGSVYTAAMHGHIVVEIYCAVAYMRY